MWHNEYIMKIKNYWIDEEKKKEKKDEEGEEEENDLRQENGNSVWDKHNFGLHSFIHSFTGLY